MQTRSPNYHSKSTSAVAQGRQEISEDLKGEKMAIAEFAALGAALCVALSNIIATPATRHFGPFAFNLWRLLAALFVLLVIATLRSGFTEVLSVNVGALVFSAFVGIVIGDTAIYAAMARIGPRRTSLLYATYAPISAALAALLLGEILSLRQSLAIALVVAGVWLATYYRHVSQVHALEEVRGSYPIGIGFGLLGALGAAGAALIMRPVMADGADASAAACVRISVALPALYGFAVLPNFRSANSPTLPMLGLAALAGALGIGGGMTLLLFGAFERVCRNGYSARFDNANHAPAAALACKRRQTGLPSLDGCDACVWRCALHCR
jgi:drug/metabolite transporter (DMT)-like permease